MQPYGPRAPKFISGVGFTVNNEENTVEVNQVTWGSPILKGVCVSVLKRVIAAASMMLLANAAEAKILSAECTARDGSSCLVSMVLAYYANQTYGIDIGVDERPVEELSVLRLASNRLSLAVMKPRTYKMLKTGDGVFTATPALAGKAAEKLRALFGYEDDQGRWATIAVNDEMSYALAYNLTAAFWNNLPSIRREVDEMNGEKPPFVGVNMPLHPGALYYFESNGFDVPEALR